MGGSIKIKKDVVPHIFECQRGCSTKLFSKRKIKVGKKKCDKVKVEQEEEPSSLAPIEWVDCGTTFLSDVEYVPET